jgi:hypothetical protein
MQPNVDDETGYGNDQDREPPEAGRGDDRPGADRSPDDFDPDSIGEPLVNPDTGAEYGHIDNRSESTT